MLEPGTTPLWEVGSRHITKTSTDKGYAAITVGKMLNDAMNRGREFTRGSTAETVINTSLHLSLNRAIDQWRRSKEKKGTPDETTLQLDARKKALEYLKKVGRG